MTTLALPEIAAASPAADAVRRGNAAFMVDDLSSAEAAYAEAVSLDGRDAVATFNAGVVRYQLGHVEEGKRSMDRGLALAREAETDAVTLTQMTEIRKVLHGPDHDSPIGGSPTDTRPS